MGRQINNSQMKRKEESPEKELSEIDARSLSDIELNSMVIRMLKEFNHSYK